MPPAMHKPCQTMPEIEVEVEMLNSPSTPTTSTSTRASAPLDGSTNPSNCNYVLDRDGDLWQRIDSTMWRCLTTQSCLVAGTDLLNVCGPLTKLLPAKSTTETTDQLRPVVNSVARTEADIAAVALDDMAMPLGPGGWESCVADLIRTAPGVLARLAAAERERDALLDQVAELEQLRSADIAVIGKLGAAVVTQNRSLTFDEFRDTNRQRCTRWHVGFPEADTWTLADWSNAMCGEAGELANVVKKIRRHETGHRPGALDPTLDELQTMAADEIGDVFAYLDLLATRMGLRLEDCAVAKFNRVSEREGHPERLG